MSKIEKYLGIANHDIQVANNSDELKSYVASILCEIDELQQENKQLQKELEEYKNPVKYFKYANKNVTEENKKLKDNWNELKEYIRKTKLNEFEKSYGKRYSKTFTQAEVIVCNIIIDHMQELEKVDK